MEEARRKLEANVTELVTEDSLNQGSAQQWSDKRYLESEIAKTW